MNTVLVPQAAELVSNPNELLGAIPRIEYAARECYQSLDKLGDSTDTFLQKLLKSGHEGPFEFGYMHVRVRTSRAIANEIVRHRLFSYCQESTRYVSYVKRGEIGYIRPNSMDVGLESSSYLHDLQHYTNQYAKMVITHHKKPEEARDYLPLCTATHLHICGNFREWRHFLSLRLSSAAHPEIQHLARMIQKLPIGVATSNQDSPNAGSLGRIFVYGMPFVPNEWTTSKFDSESKPSTRANAPESLLTDVR